MSVTTLQRASSLPFYLAQVDEESVSELHREADLLLTEIEALEAPGKWCFKKGLRLIEIGKTLHEPFLIEMGQLFFDRIGMRLEHVT